MIPIRLVPVLLFVLIMAVAGSRGRAEAGTGNTWVTAAPLLSGRWSDTAASADGKLFLFGGFGCSTNACTTFDAYDPVKDSWASMGEPPTDLGGLASATAGPDGRIYIYTSGAAMSVYDAGTNTWSQAPAPPNVDDSAQLVTGLDGRIYAVGGRVNGTAVGAISAFSVSSRTWTVLKPLSLPHGSAGVAVGSDGRIYVIGGELLLRGVTKRVDAYDPKTNSWSTVAPLHFARAELRAVSGPDGRIYAIGGGVGSRCFTSPCNVVEAYDVKSNTWTQVAPLPHPRWWFAAAVGPDKRMYVLGGSNAVGYAPPEALVTAVDAYTVVSADQPLPAPAPGPTSVTKTLKPMPTARENLGVAVASGRVYAVGGQQVLAPQVLPPGAPTPAPEILRTVEAYDVSKGTWTTEPSLPGPRQGMGVTAGSDGRIYVFGGVPTLWEESAMNVGGLRSMLVYDPRTRRWSARQPMPDARYGVAAVTGKAGRIYLIGGATHCDTGDDGECYGTRVVRSFDPRTGVWKSLASLKVGQVSAAAAVGTDGRIFVFGGDTLAGLPDPRFEIYDPRTDRWSWGAKAPNFRTGAVAAATDANGRIDLIGGCFIQEIHQGGYSASCGSPSPVDSYDPRTNRWTTPGLTLNFRQGLAAATGPDGRVYAVGGAGDGGGRLLEVIKAVPSTASR